VRVVIAGAHGQIARRLGRLLSARGDTVAGIVRDPGQRADLESDGVEPVVLDLERASVDQVAHVVDGADAVVFAAGGGPGSGIARKDTVDRAAAVLLADAAVAAGVRPYLLVSSIGVEQVAGGATPEGMDEVFVAYLRAKLAAEEHVLAERALAPMVVRPGALTDEPGSGRVRRSAPATAAPCHGTTSPPCSPSCCSTPGTAWWPSSSPATPPSATPWRRSPDGPLQGPAAS
jgi:nucleoside-diphosphate-sugar epimerase